MLIDRPEGDGARRDGARGPQSPRPDHRRGHVLGGIVHTLPFLIPQYHTALIVAPATIAVELLALARIRG
jgi:hypothetical protein